MKGLPFISKIPSGFDTPVQWLAREPGGRGSPQKCPRPQLPLHSCWGRGVSLLRSPASWRWSTVPLTSNLGSCFRIPFREIPTSNMPEWLPAGFVPMPRWSRELPCLPDTLNPRTCRPRHLRGRRGLGVRGGLLPTRRKAQCPAPLLHVLSSQGNGLGHFLQAGNELRLSAALGTGMAETSPASPTITAGAPLSQKQALHIRPQSLLLLALLLLSHRWI